MNPNETEALLVSKPKEWKSEKKREILEKEIMSEEEEEFGSRLMIGGTSALLEGP